MADRVCVYAVVSGASGPVRGHGASGERLRRIRVAGLDLVVGVVPRTPRATTEALRRYDAVVRALVKTHGSVLPARYGTCAPTLDGVAATVMDRRDTLRRALRLVRHRVQMTVRVFSPGSDRGQAGVRVGVGVGVGSGVGSGVGPLSGRLFLQRRAAELLIPGTEPLRLAVKRWIRAERHERHERGRIVGTIYHLIPRTAAPGYHDAIHRAALAAGLTVVVSGPWPPYAFAGGGW